MYHAKGLPAASQADFPFLFRFFFPPFIFPFSLKKMPEALIS
ncbi:hypothetical protein FD23_GL000456 [Lactobacillus delbrueckii subsp. delbrueckii DSM 20074 = JCM 1012]|nr:hypothetical protein [Lactobacillus delbrueckii]KRK27199.1 hypothetical protein FD23_GL000456 [Lactobacillus delbrueckii subsp. delbrueckii DSM 20074 = JCM 1012]